MCVCVCVQTSFEFGTKIVKLGLKNVARFAFHEWNKFFNGLAKETKHTILELDGI